MDSNIPIWLRPEDKRPQALTYPLLSQSSTPNLLHQTINQQTSHQAQSALFSKLPTELRQLIWARHLGGHLLHVVDNSTSFLTVICTEDTGWGLETSQHRCWRYDQDRSISSGTLSANPPKTLLQTCRLIYNESVSMLYTNNIFDMNGHAALRDLWRSPLPQRLHQIRALRLSWTFHKQRACSHHRNNTIYDHGMWQMICDLLTTFTGLRELVLHLTIERPQSVAMEARMFLTAEDFKTRQGKKSVSRLPVFIRA